LNDDQSVSASSLAYSSAAGGDGGDDGVGVVENDNDNDNASVENEDLSSAGGSSATPGGSWRSMGSIRGGMRGGVGGRGGTSRNIYGTNGTINKQRDQPMQRDIAGNPMIGTNYEYNTSGFDLNEHTRIRQHEFIQSTRDKNEQDLKNLTQMPPNTSTSSLSGRINSFVKSYNKAVRVDGDDDNGDSEAGGGSTSNSVIAPDVAEAKSGDSDNKNNNNNNSNDNDNGNGNGETSPGPNGGQWDTIGSLVQEYEVKISLSRQSSKQVLPGVSVDADADAGTITMNNIDDNDANAYEEDLDYGSVSSMGQMSITNDINHRGNEAKFEFECDDRENNSRGGLGLNSNSVEFQQGTATATGVGALGEGSQELARPSLETMGTMGTTKTYDSKFPKFGGGIPNTTDRLSEEQSALSWGKGVHSLTSARPHHLPQMTGELSSRLEMIKATMAVKNELEVPWDKASGKPIRIKKKEAKGAK